mmetsp:Transcript_10474/g.27751  ORF Transcript_10474/g.27751 Transcript_10474/m.27751 type:complete len:222 (-) Transcript_10474:715-1380(-)
MLVRLAVKLLLLLILGLGFSLWARRHVSTISPSTNATWFSSFSLQTSPRRTIMNSTLSGNCCRGVYSKIPIEATKRRFCKLVNCERNGDLSMSLNRKLLSKASTKSFPITFFIEAMLTHTSSHSAPATTETLLLSLYMAAHLPNESPAVNSETTAPPLSTCRLPDFTKYAAATVDPSETTCSPDSCTVKVANSATRSLCSTEMPSKSLMEHKHCTFSAARL